MQTADEEVEDDVCRRIFTTDGNNDTDSSNASANGNSNGNSNSAPRTMASLFFPPSNSQNNNGRNNTSNNVNEQVSYGSVAPIDTITPTAAENLAFERPAPHSDQSASTRNSSLNSASKCNKFGPSTSEHSAASMLGSMLSREEDSS